MSCMVVKNYDFVKLRGLVQSPCGKINVIMTLGGGGEGVLVHDVLQLHCQQTGALVVLCILVVE